MARWLSNYATDVLLDASDALPATLWVQLHTGNPGPDGTDSVSGETTRQSFTRTAASSGFCANVAPMVWSSLAGAIGETINHHSVWSDATGGNCWGVGNWDEDIGPVASGDTLTVADGAFFFGLDPWF